MRRALLLSLVAVPSGISLAQEAFDVQLLDTRTQFADYAPVPRDSGFVMCSIRERSGGAIGFTDAATNMPLSDLYWVPMRNGVPAAPAIFSEAVTTPVNEGPSAFHPDGRTFCYTRNQLLPKRMANLRKGNDALGLYFSISGSGGWSAPTAFEHNSAQHSIAHPAFSTTGDTLFFASDMPGGQGGMDLYFSVRMDDTWGPPVNMGKPVNSEANEGFPSIDRNGHLFFASDREGGFGKLDILTSVRSHGQWGPPQWLPSPVNSAANDMGLVFDATGHAGLFSSDRTGSDRIYSARRTIERFVDCPLQQIDNFCYAVRTRPHAVTRELPLDHVWDMGDSTHYTGTEAKHCYARPGMYKIRSLLVDRRSGATFLELNSNMVEVVRNEQAFVRSPDTLRTGRTVQLDATLSHTPNFTPVETHWSMGDGATLQGNPVRHRFNAPGVYEVLLHLVGAPDAEGNIAHSCNSKRIVVLDKYRENEDMTVIATYQDAMGVVHFREYRELPFDELTMNRESNEDARFAIELFTSRDRVSLDDPRFAEVRKHFRIVEHYDPERGLYCYSVGGTSDLKELYKTFQKLRQLEFMNAEVYKMMDEKLVDISVLDFARLEELDRKKLRTSAIRFAFGSADLGDTTFVVLEQVARLMGAHPTLHVVIEAHTDDVGSLSFNMDLSQKRAQSVVKHLVEHGVEPDRMVAVGHGKNQPIASNKTVAGRGRNRRVEFRMVVKDEYVEQGR